MISWASTCRFILTKVMGWTIDTSHAPEQKCVLIGVPHTSAWDFVVSYLYYRSTGKKARVMVKKEMFVWPLGGLLKKLGAIPVDRSSGAAVTKSVISHMRDADEFHLAIAPEGTRKPVRKWKTGYHTIAKGVGCPVYLCYFDWGTKHVGYARKFDLTDDARSDTDRMQAEYEEMHLVGKHPEYFITK